MDSENSKRMKPKELEAFYACRGSSDQPPCPIFDFCFYGDGSNCETCQGTWQKYLRMQDQGKI